jgi:hypothetical protein
MLVCAFALLCLAASGAVAQESKDSNQGEPGKIARAGATRERVSVTLDASGLTGCWETGESGWLVWLVQRGNRVWGYYMPRPNRKGRLHGTIQGNRLTYSWWENEENGHGYFEIADDRQSMRGNWHYDFTKSWGGNWGVTRTIGTAEAARDLETVENAVDRARASAGELAKAFMAYSFAADPRSRVHDRNACCGKHAEQLRQSFPAIKEALKSYAGTAKLVDRHAGTIAGHLIRRLAEADRTIKAHEATTHLPAANRAMERVKLALHAADDAFVWLEASFAIEVACRRLRLHLAAPEEAQDKEEFQRALTVVNQTATTLQAHFRANEDPLGVALAGQMAQMAIELDEVVAAGLDAGGELREAALARIEAGYAALLAKKREIDAVCGVAP